MQKIVLIIILSTLNSFVSAQTTNFGTQFSDAIIQRYQPSIDIMTNKGWDHANSVILHGIEKTYLKSKNPKHLNYIKEFVDAHIDNKGTISGLKPELDRIQPGMICLFLYEKTGDNKYKLAATYLKNYLLGTSSSPSVFNKTPDGGYWHKNDEDHTNVMSIDGAYMLNPFLAKYGTTFNDKECIDAAVFQLLLVASRTFNIDSNLPYHGWSFDKNKPWANAITGTSTEVWSRSVGWFSMALVDVLEYLPKTHQEYNKVVYLFQQLAIGLKNTQNATDGMWYQLMSYKNLHENYPEASGSGMIVYSLKKGVTNGWLDESFNTTINKGWDGLKNCIVTNNDGKVQINSFSPGMSIKNNAKEYIDVRPVNCPSPDEKQNPHGYFGILMAASQLEE